MDEVRITIAVPKVALYALLDPESPLADPGEAQRLGLLNKKRELTEIGKLVLDAADVVALRHKLILAARGPQEI